MKLLRAIDQVVEGLMGAMLDKVATLQLHHNLINKRTINSLQVFKLKPFDAVYL